MTLSIINIRHLETDNFPHKISLVHLHKYFPLMNTLSSYEHRVTDGTYDDIFDYLLKLNSLTLAGAEFEKDFVPNQIDGSHGCNYLNRLQNTEFETIVFGEILPEAAGTQINAKGNHFISNDVYFRTLKCNPLSFFDIQVKPITDDVKIKLPIFLGVPTAAPDKLRHLFENQIVTLNDIRMADKIKEEENHLVRVLFTINTSSIYTTSHTFKAICHSRSYTQ